MGNNMTNKTVNYRGYEIGWQDPPLTSAGFDMSIASDDRGLMGRLEAHSGMRGAHNFRATGTEEQRLTEAKHYIDAVLGN